MAGQFSDTGSKYALESLTGYRGVSTTLASAVSTSGYAIASSGTSAASTKTYATTVFTVSSSTGLFVGNSLFFSTTNGLTLTATDGSTTGFTVTGINGTLVEVAATYTGTFTANQPVWWYPAARPKTYLALTTAQPLDNNASVAQSFALNEYGATGYARQPIVWNASSASNSGPTTVFVGHGTFASTNNTIGGLSTVTGPTISPSTSGTQIAATSTSAVSTGSAGNPANQVTVTTTANHNLGLGETVTLSGFTGSGGSINTTAVITSVPSPTTFTVVIAGTSGSYTASTANNVVIGGPFNITFTLYQTTAGSGTPALYNTTTAGNTFVVGSTVNIKGVPISGQNNTTYDLINVPIIATSTNTITVETPNVPSTLTNTAYSVTQALPITALTGGTSTTAVSSGGVWKATITGLNATTGLAVGMPFTVANSSTIAGGAPAQLWITAILSASSISYAYYGGTAAVNTAGAVGNLTPLPIATNTVFNNAGGAIGTTNATSGFITYNIANSFTTGDTIQISGITGTTNFNGVRTVYAANSTQFVVYDAVATLTVGGAGISNTLTGTITATRIGAVTQGAQISGPATSQTFGGTGFTTAGSTSSATGFSANTGATITHAALVTQPGGVFAISGITWSTNIATVTTTTAHNLNAGNTVYIQNCVDPVYNGYWVVAGCTSTTTFTLATTYTNTPIGAGGTVSGSVNGEVVAWWALDTARTPAVNDTVTVGTSALSLYVN